MAGVQAASEAALLLDFLGHVCCGVSRRRPLPGKRGQKSRQGGGSLRISSAKLRVRFVCVRRPQRQAFAFLASVPGISEHAVKLTARLATLTATFASSKLSRMAASRVHTSASLDFAVLLPALEARPSLANKSLPVCRILTLNTSSN